MVEECYKCGTPAEYTLLYIIRTHQSRDIGFNPVHDVKLSRSVCEECFQDKKVINHENYGMPEHVLDKKYLLRKDLTKIAKEICQA